MGEEGVVQVSMKWRSSLSATVVHFLRPVLQWEMPGIGRTVEQGPSDNLVVISAWSRLYPFSLSSSQAADFVQISHGRNGSKHGLFPRHANHCPELSSHPSLLLFSLGL